MADARIRLYGIPMSHPVMAARGMIERKGLDYRYVELLAGAHPPSLWALGFRGMTVPAMRLPDGRRVQGSLAIARALEEVAPAPVHPLGPAQEPAPASLVRRCRHALARVGRHERGPHAAGPALRVAGRSRR